MSTQQNDTLARLAATFAQEITAAGRSRHANEQVTEGPFGLEFAWQGTERRMLLGLVNAERADRGLEPATEADIYQAEVFASGHFDPAGEYGLGCARLALGQEAQ